MIYILTGPAGFFEISGSSSCYYASYPIQLNYADAKADCEARGAMLACPRNKDQLTALYNYLRSSK